MATLTKRAWQTASGEQREAWLVTLTDQHGQRIRKQFDRKKDADAFMVDARGKVAAGSFTAESTSATIGEACELWLQRAEAEGLERSTLEQYKSHVKHIQAVLPAVTRLAKLTTARCEQLRDDLMPPRHSRATARKVLTSFKSIVADAKRRGLIAHNPASDTRIGANGRHKRKLEAGRDFPLPAEVRTLLDAADAKGRALVALAALAGLRASEIRGLPWGDLHLTGDKPTVTIRQRADRFGAIGSPKSDDSGRTVPLSATAAAALLAWRGDKIYPGSALVFATASGKPDMLGNLQRRLLDPLQVKAGIVDRDGLPKYSFHAFRHYAVSSWLAARIDQKTAQHWAGHATLALTLDTYGHLIPRADDHDRMADVERALAG
jgi:integrase